MRARVWRITVISAALVATGGPVAFAQDAAGDPAGSGEPPVTETVPGDSSTVGADDAGVATGTVDTATVAVGLPPVPPVNDDAGVAVAVGLPPVPPAEVAVAVAVGLPPVPPEPVADESPAGRPVVSGAAASDAPASRISEEQIVAMTASISGAIAAVAGDAWLD
jgi:hypothetical protein